MLLLTLPSFVNAYALLVIFCNVMLSEWTHPNQALPQLLREIQGSTQG